MKERPLVIFTILASMAVGAFLALGLVYWQMTRLAGAAAADQLVDGGLLLIGPLMLFSLIASLFHLGSPQNAWLALSNLRRSWLSREVLFAVLFTGLGGMFALAHWLRLGEAPARALLAGLAALSGLALVYCMGRVYMLRTAPAWNSWLTLASFFTASFLLGSLGLGLALVAQSAVAGAPQNHVATALSWLGGFAILLLVIEFLLIPWTIGRLAAQPAGPGINRPLSQVYLLRLAPILLGVALAGVVFFSPGALDRWGAFLMVAIACGLALFSEVFGRILFYESRNPLL
jgi:anaerobic dimethyl sulfoxide reductase subunit C (anchor subunit)